MTTGPLLAEALESCLSAGDIFPDSWDGDIDASHGPLVVLSHGCDIDKSETVLVAGIELNANTPNDGRLGDIRRGRVWHAFDLEGSAEPGWANLRTIRNLPKRLLVERLDRRLHSMTEPGRLALAMKVFGFLTRSVPPSG